MATQAQITVEQLQALHKQFREIKHEIANDLAVISGACELAELNPIHIAKLSGVATRCRQICNQLQTFSEKFGADVSAAGPAEPAAAAAPQDRASFP